MKEQIAVRRDITHTTLSILFIGAFIASSFWILRPFLMSLAWASIIVIATWPVVVWLQTRLNRRGLVVTLMAAAMLLVVLVPMMLAVLIIAKNADNITEQARALTTYSLSSPPDWVEHLPLVGGKIAQRWRDFASLSPEERSAMVTPYGRTVLQWFAAQAGSIGMAMLQFLLTVIIAMILYANGEVARDGVLRFARRLAGQQGEDVAVLAGKAVRGVVLGVVGTALIQASVGGLGLLITGVPAVALLTAVMFILCLAQIGPFLVLIPSVIWLYWSGQPVWGTVMLVITVVAGTVDNIIRPFLIKKGADLPLLLIFSGVLGGLVAFGIIGLFIGPVILAVTYTLLKVWVSGDTPEARAGSDAE